MNTLGHYFLLATSTLSLASYYGVEGLRMGETESPVAKSPFRIVIDGGSTGSRLHIFEFVKKQQHNGDILDEMDCVRRGTKRANIPLSAFARGIEERDSPLNATHVAEHLIPLFEYAATIIPLQYHATTDVKYQATAGMRLVEEEEQDAVYDALHKGLMRSESFPFTGMARDDISTLSGELEGFYGAVAANYLKGVVDTDLRTKVLTEGPLGALDMGGSSTQIVFLPSSSKSESVDCKAKFEQDGEEIKVKHTDCTTDIIPSQLRRDDFFKTSYLSYGVDQFRERLWATWIEDHKENEGQDDALMPATIENPCCFKGYTIEFQGYLLLGTGSAEQCKQQVRRLIPHHDRPYDIHTKSSGQVGGVKHPPVRGKFFAMSLFFFSLDALRALSHPDKEAHDALNSAWPNPSIEELDNALDGLCGRNWEGDLELIQHNSHAFTRAAVLPHRCIESVYMVTLLRDGFGFAPESRDITFTFLVDGSEVEWSLGMALALHAEDKHVHISSDHHPHHPHHHKKEEEKSEEELNRTTPCADKSKPCGATLVEMQRT